MNIVYDFQAFRQRYGGISRYYFEIARCISSDALHHVLIAALLHRNEYLVEAEAFEVRGFKVPNFPCTSSPIKFINNLFARASLQFEKNIDIFHETFYSRRDCCPASAKRVVTVYDMISEKINPHSAKEERLRLEKKYAVHRADHIICISKNTQKDLVEILGVPLEKTSVVYLGNSLLRGDKFKKISVSCEPYILYVGARSGYKNFTNLLIAFGNSCFLQSNFRIICFGGGVFTDDEKILIKSLGISLNSVSHVEGGDLLLANFYASASVLVYPSIYEGFGIPPLEAMSFNCPVACSNSSSLPEVVGDAALKFDPEDVAEIQATIELIVSSSRCADNLREKGQNRLAIFSWEKCAKDTLEVYKKLLSQ